MEIDHIFIFSANKGDEADLLVELGFVEGSNRIHPGQGTVNRKFYFENFFLEILWVRNELEIRSEISEPIKLWQRAEFKENGSSPYGLCLVPTADTNQLFNNALSYQPGFFPEGMAIDVITNEFYSHLPWCFRLPFTGSDRKADEPKNHPNGIKKLTKATFCIQDLEAKSEFIKKIQMNSIIHFKEGTEDKLVLEFDDKQQGLRKEIEELRLVIYY